MLERYAAKKNIGNGCVFITRNGRPLDRSNIWAEMKKLCKKACVLASKVFPHNLRHLFGKTFYTKYQDIGRLADLLGHSSINTTRIYTLESGEIHRNRIQNLGLILDLTLQNYVVTAIIVAIKLAAIYVLISFIGFNFEGRRHSG